FAARWQRPLALMQEGAQRLDARPQVDWRKGFGNAASLLTMRNLVNAATIEVRRQLALSQPRAAVELSLATMTFTADWLQSPMLIDQWIAAATLSIATGDTWRDEDLRRLDGSSRELLADGLRVLDGRSAPTMAMDGELLLLADTLLAAG